MNQKNIFVVAGRTGGPLLPAMAIANNIDNSTPVIIGVSNGFEVRYAKGNNIKLEFLPEAKLTLLSFSNLNLIEVIFEIFNFILMIFKLIFSFFKSIYLIIKYKPAAIITCASFLAVPLTWANKLLLVFKLSNAKIILHQQDAKVSLSNKLIKKIADIKSCFFESTKSQLDAKFVIPNPIDYSKFDNTDSLTASLDPEIIEFINNAKKPLLLVFGGGSGAFAINKWVSDEIVNLKKHFTILHLTGVLQNSSILSIDKDNDYHSIEYVTTAMPYLLKRANLIICRAGMGSISELLYLNKPAFLIPIPNSHQESNAKEVVEYFPSLRQQFTFANPGKEQWIEMIIDFYPSYFEKIKYPSSLEVKNRLSDYFKMLNEEINKSL